MTLLVLASPTDESARRLSDYASSRGQSCIISNDLCDFNVSIHVGRSGIAKTHLATRRSGRAITAVLNRGLGTLTALTVDEQFKALEVLATWWSALALFSGPVINRPGPESFLPSLEDLTLANGLTATIASRAVITDAAIPEFYAKASTVNIHRLRDSHYLGRLDETHQNQEDEVHLYTPFEETATHRLLIAGKRVFDLSDYEGRLSPELLFRARPLITSAHHRGANFAIIVVEQIDDDLGVLQASAHPHEHQYRHIEDSVYESLYGYLIS